MQITINEFRADIYYYTRRVKQIIMRTCIFVIVLLFGSISVIAQQQLVVELEDGRNISYLLSDVPLVTFQDSAVCVRSKAVQADYERSQVRRFFFEDSSSGVDALKGGLRIEYVSKDKIVLYGTSSAFHHIRSIRLY